ncbi:MAG: acyl--CoA ligase [Candidatus Latescibacteria bacterium]|nr:acyl--CoA ligase [Candidatus Latescibacterota bacterium]
MRLIHQYLLEAACRTPDKTALICDDKPLVYDAFIHRMQALSGLLIDAGLRKGDRALIVISDKMDFLVACYAVIAAGGLAVPIMEGAAAATIQQVAHDCTPQTLLSTSQDLTAYPDLRERVRCSIMLLDTTGPASPHDPWHRATIVPHDALHRGNGSLRTPDIQEDDGAFILYTSGTTGKKKGVLLSHRNLIQSTLNINEFMGIDADIREFVAIPLTHSFGFGRSRCVLFVGGTLVVTNGMFNPVAAVQQMREHRCDALSSVPSGFALFFGRMESSLCRIGPQVRFVEIGSAPMRLDHKLKLTEVFPNARLCMHYGLTEASRSAFIEFRHDRDKLDTVGRPAPHVEIAILPDQEPGEKDGQTGEIAVRGAHVAAGYWQNGDLNAQRFTEDGWFKTGDYGFLDEDGYLHLLGRKDDIINMGGLKISPIEVEESIRTAYPHCEVCVVGIPDPAGLVGEIPVLCYVSRDGSSITLPELSHALSSRLDRHKIPRIVYRLEQLSKTENGKILRHELRRTLLDGVVPQHEKSV